MRGFIRYRSLRVVIFMLVLSLTACGMAMPPPCPGNALSEPYRCVNKDGTVEYRMDI